MRKKSVRDLSLAGKRVLMRVDFNVPLEDGVVVDDTRIVAALPTIRHVVDQGAALVLMSHVGRPRGKPHPGMSLKPMASVLAHLLGKPVEFADDCVGDSVMARAKDMEAGQILLLENLRFHPEEEAEVKIKGPADEEKIFVAKSAMKERQWEFSKQLAELGNVYVNDAFGTAHRAHASVSVVTKFLQPCAAGFLLEKEIEYLGHALDAPRRPFVAILGGAKISGKIDVIEALLGRVDSLLVGGAMAYTFFRAMGHATGNSLVEEDKIGLAGDLLDRSRVSGVNLMLPSDTVVADKFSVDANIRTVGLGGINPGWTGLDIGPVTRQRYAEVVSGAGTVVWNGPMGAFEMEPFASGTQAMAEAVAASDCVSIIGGGDSVSAIKQAGLADRMTHISTGGGASLEFLEGKTLPGMAALDDVSV